MSLISKLFISTLIATVALSANSQPNKRALLKYVKQHIVKNPQVKVEGLTILESKTDRRLRGWSILLTTMDLEFQGRKINAPKIMFVKDGLVADTLIDLRTGVDYSREIKPTMPQSFYNKEHRLFGNADAKHKIVIFSDPQCPYCQTVVPAIFQASIDNPSKIAIYYYHLPLLRIHPVSDVLTRVMHVAQHKGRADVVKKIYSLKINPKETNVSTILSAVKRHTGYSIYSYQINRKRVKDALKADEKSAGRMMVSGTPTIYIDGKLDKKRDGYKKLISWF